MIVHVLQIIYYTQHLRYQIMLLNEYIVNISDCSLNIDEKKLFDDEEYQATIENRLKFCIRRWDEYLLAYNQKCSEVKRELIFFSLSGWLLCISFAIIMISGKITPEYYPRQTITGLAVILTFCGAIEAGQATETQMKEMASVVNEVKWYNFNKTNKKL
ncbi:uncharacterized protein LOC135129836 [Zophobas morio]|uniref:uncharacterized protein LOC135129836 n=1 Tax=Zophobas morio TaxID=2755281 RepID=UPI003083D592